MHGPAPTLLDDDGNASMATAVMMSHHGLRRDLALFARTLAQQPTSWGPDTAGRLKQAWTDYRNVLHGHHEAEDTRMFPGMRGQHPELAAVFDQLTADHRRIDPLLIEGDQAFAQLPDTKAASALVSHLWALLGPHLRLEEEKIIPLLREARTFPPPASEEIELFAQGFAWGSHGIAPEVLEKVYAMLPPELSSRLPAARAAFQQKHDDIWGRSAPTGTSHTCVPDWLGGELGL